MTAPSTCVGRPLEGEGRVQRQSWLRLHEVAFERALSMRAVRYLLVGCLALISCAHEVVRQPAALTPTMVAASNSVIEILQDVVITLDSGYSRQLARGSRWMQVGTLPQGHVFRIVGGAFTVEGANVHEAWLVIAGGELVGFYLPVEKAFVHLSARVRLEFKTASP